MDEYIKNMFVWTDEENMRVANVNSIREEDRKQFWSYWHKNKTALKSSGVSMKKKEDGNFYIYFTDTQDLEEREKNRLESLESSRASFSDIYVPSPPGLNYFPYQKAAIKFASDRESTLIADEPGLGKTLEVAGVINLNDKIKNVLIICPASIRINWKRELDKWLVRRYNVGIVNRDYYPTTSDIVIINFDVVHKHHKTLVSKTWDLFVIDEVHFLKSKATRRSKYIFGSKRDGVEKIRAEKKIFLSGTPIVNRPIELFPIINSLDPITWSDQWSYAKRYCDLKHNGYGWDYTGSSNLDELQDRLRSSIMIRRLKKDVLLDLPPKFRQVIELPMDSSMSDLVNLELREWDAYEELVDSLWAALTLSKINEDEESYRDEIDKLSQQTKAKFSEIAALRERVALLKVPYVIEHLRNFEHKVVVFAHHKSVVKKIRESFPNETVEIVGDTKMDDRQKAVDLFQNDPSVRYFIGSIKSAGVGITLTAASHVVFAELDWVPGAVSQCEDRCHRITQKGNVLVQHMVLEGSLDAKIAKSLIAKQEVIDKALDVGYDVSRFSIQAADEVTIPYEYQDDYDSRDEGNYIFSEEEKVDLLNKIKLIASLDNDRASYVNGIGFNRFDGRIGHSLAGMLHFTNRQAEVAEKLVTKYKKQLEAL